MQDKTNSTYTVITGANSGIGKALAKVYKTNGHRLLLLSRNIDMLNELKSEDVFCEKVDVSDRNTLENIFSYANSKLGTVECLINNAGYLDAEVFNQQDPLTWQHMINSNLLGAAHITQIVSQHMTEYKHGTIININSIAGRRAFPNLAMYCSTKHALCGLSDAIRLELAPYNIRVMSVLPGFTDTNLYQNIKNVDIHQSIKNWSDSLGNILSPEDVAEFIYSLYMLPIHINIPEVYITPTKQI